MNDIEIIGSNLYYHYKGIYSYDDMVNNLEEKGNIVVSGIRINDLNQLINDDCEVMIKIGELRNGYIYLFKECFGIKNDFAFEEQSFYKLNLKKKNLIIHTGMIFDKGINVIASISDCVKTSCFVVSEQNKNYGKNGYILDDDFKNILRQIPNSNEIKLYKAARIENAISDYFDISNGIDNYNKYIRNKLKPTELDFATIDRSYEIANYEYAISQLEECLKMPFMPEEEWQSRLSPLIPLLYPRYVRCYSKVPVIQNDKKRENKELDFLLADIDGNVCIVELKKPFSDKSILRLYRNNYAPCAEFSGAIQQIHKYIWDYNNFKKENIIHLKEKYGEDFKLINPQGVLIYGRSNAFDDKQKLDFEIIRKQYKDIVDIVTYDDLIDRLKRTIVMLKKK